jgi:hypothetical protein
VVILSCSHQDFVERMSGWPAFQTETAAAVDSAA